MAITFQQLLDRSEHIKLDGLVFLENGHIFNEGSLYPTGRISYSQYVTLKILYKHRNADIISTQELKDNLTTHNCSGSDATVRNVIYGIKRLLPDSKLVAIRQVGYFLKSSE